MTTDRELLELAARAVGIELEWCQEWCGGQGCYMTPVVPAPTDPILSKRVPWNPLQDDGDALRLAVKLRLSIDHNHSADQQRWVAADRNGCEGCYAPVSCVEDDFDDESQRSSATRRAITRAAAQMQLQEESA